MRSRWQVATLTLLGACICVPCDADVWCTQHMTGKRTDAFCTQGKHLDGYHRVGAGNRECDGEMTSPDCMEHKLTPEECARECDFEMELCDGFVISDQLQCCLYKTCTVTRLVNRTRVTDSLVFAKTPDTSLDNLFPAIVIGTIILLLIVVWVLQKCERTNPGFLGKCPCCPGGADPQDAPLVPVGTPVKLVNPPAKGGGAFKHGVEVSNPMWSGDEDSDEDDVSGADIAASDAASLAAAALSMPSGPTAMF